MTKNIHKIERGIRVVLGLGLIVCASAAEEESL